VAAADSPRGRVGVVMRARDGEETVVDEVYAKGFRVRHLFGMIKGTWSGVPFRMLTDAVSCGAVGFMLLPMTSIKWIDVGGKGGAR